MKIKKVYSSAEAKREFKQLSGIRYYINGRWRIERRKEHKWPINGIERRRAA